jgi:single-stranded-DNA-specific exonuclease
MQVIPDSFLTFGGHHASGGFSVSHEQAHSLAEALLGAYKTLGAEGSEVHQEKIVDAQITLNDITDTFVRSLQILAPFGMGNPKPLFEIRDVTPIEVQIFGKTQNHTKLRLRTPEGRCDAICFFKLPTDFSALPEAGKPVHLLAHIERSFFMGRLETRIRIVDII